MEYGKLLATSWNTSLPNNAELYPIFPTTHSETKHISPLGWKIFKSLIRNPGSSIIELSKINNKPRNTIARWLHFFQQNNLYLTRYIPDLGKLGFNILTFYNLSTRGFSIKNRIKYLELLRKNLFPTDLFTSQRNIIIYTASKDYYSLREAETSLFKELEKEGIPFILNRKISFSTGNIFSPKVFHKSLIPLIDYLQSPEKYSLRPFREDLFDNMDIN